MNTDDPTPEKAETDGDVTVYCAMCGTTGVGPPLTWVLDVDPRRGSVHYCAGCARQHLRAIEGRLQQEWW